MKYVINIVAVLFIFSACDLVRSADNTPISLGLEMKSSDIKTLQDIEADFAITNVSGDEVTYEFTSSCQYGFKIEQNGNTLFNSTNARGCLAMITELKLAPLKSKTYHISLEGMQGSDILEDGKYRLTAFLLNEQSPKVNTSFVVE